MSNYADKIEGIINNTLVGFALTLAWDLEILSILIDSQQKLTSDEIAKKEDLEERYVREILDCLATAQVIRVDIDEAGSLVYYLDPDEKGVLRYYRLCFFHFLEAMRDAVDAVKLCVDVRLPPGKKFPQEFVDSVSNYHITLFYTYLDYFYCYGRDLDKKLENGIEVLEVACLEADMTANMADQHPKSTFTAMDNDTSYHAKQKINVNGISNARLVTFDLYSPDSVVTQQYDWIFCVNGIHDAPVPLVALTNIGKLLKPNCMFMMIDRTASGNPINDIGNLRVAGMYSISTFFNIPESFHRDSNSEARGLCWGKQTAMKILSAAGFSVQVSELDRGMTLYTCKWEPPISLGQRAD